MNHRLLPFLLFLLLCCFDSSAQLLLQNGDFETASTNPTGGNQVNLATPWNQLIFTPDFLMTGFFEENFWAAQIGGANSGAGYAGLYASFGGPQGWFAEAIGQDISATPIQDGETYEVSFVGKMSTNSLYEDCGGLELYGFENPPTPITGKDHVSAFPGAVLLWTSNAIGDVNWELFEGSFTASGNFNYLAVTLEQPDDCQQYSFYDDLVITGGNFVVNEICDNGIDDDDDGLVDYFDPDCPCLDTEICGNPYYNTCVQECSPSTSSNDFTMEGQNTGITVNGLYNIMVVADVNGDCSPDMITLTDYTTLGVIDGPTASVLYESEADGYFGYLCTADTDLDGMSEIFVIYKTDTDDDFFMSRFDYNPTINNIELTWVSNLPIDELPSDFVIAEMIPMIADFNQDGRPEVFIGNQIFDSETGVELVKMGDLYNRGGARQPNPNYSIPKVYGIKNSAVAVDILDDNSCVDCEGLELVAGNQVFSVDIQSYTNPNLNSMEIARELPGFEDGVTAIVDFDQDGDLDVVVSDFNGEYLQWNGRVYIWDPQSISLIGEPVVFEIEGVLTSIPGVADVDGDGSPEIIINTKEFMIFEDYATGGGANWGADFSTVIRAQWLTDDHGAGFAMFDFNGDGTTEIVARNNDYMIVLDGDLNILAEVPVKAFTAAEAPIIVDIDDDNQAEIVTWFADDFDNSYNHEIRIFDSAGLPWSNSRKVWNQYSAFNVNINEDGTIPIEQQAHHLVGQNGELNNFNEQYAMPEGNFTSTVDLGNDLTSCAGSVLSFNATGFDNYNWTTSLGQTCDTCTNFILEVVENVEIILVANTTEGCTATDTINVTVSDLATSNTAYLCQGESLIIDNQEIFSDTVLTESLISTLGCDSLHTTTVILLDTFYTEEIIVLCDGEVATVFGNPITTSAVLSETFSSYNGCDSTHQVSVVFNETFATFENLQFCDGDSVTIYGTEVVDDAVISETFTAVNGCDSIHEVSVEFLENVTFSAILQACDGDTLFVQGNPITESEVIIENYTAFNGCDSVLQFIISFSESYFTTEIVNACQGDTVMVFGTGVTSAGTFESTFTAENSCDSTHQITLFFNENSFTSETLEFCDGEVAEVLGQTLTTDGVVEQVYPAFNGCDSTHQVTVVFNELSFTEESLQFCEGDTAFVFGLPYLSNAVVQETFVDVNNCDSVHQVTLSFLAELLTNSVEVYCEGDTAVIFGELIFENQILESTFVSTGGCDSTHQVEAVFNANVFTTETISPCEGDTVFIFGTAYSSDAVASATFTAANSCDSTHQVDIDFIEIVYTSEVLEFCDGDSVLIYGTTFIDDAEVEATFEAYSGCDSIHQFILVFNEVFNTTETLELCEGETIVIGGQTISDDLVVQQVFESVNGCDSIHSTTCNFTNTIYTSELVQLCEGETITVFGNTVTDNDVLIENYTGSSGCDSIHEVTVYFTELVELLFYDTLCPGDYLLFFEDTIYQSGTYTQTLSPLSEGCDSSYILTVNVLPEIDYNMTETFESFAGELLQLPLNVSDPNLEFSWSPAEYLSCADCQRPELTLNQSQAFTVTITNIFGCNVEAFINVSITDKQAIYIPNAFSPNGDQYNDYFTAFANEGIIEIEKMLIFNRWGAAVYEGINLPVNDDSVGWDGRFKGELMNPGVYVYQIWLKSDTGALILKSGDVTLLN